MSYSAIACSRNVSAVLAKTCILSSRSVLAVSSVITV